MPLALVTLSFPSHWNPLVALAGTRRIATPVAGETLRLLPGQDKYLGAVERVVRQHVGNEELFLAPNMPALYCVLAKRAPVWWIDFYFPMTEGEQRALVDTLGERRVRWALIGSPPGGRAKSFQKTHPLVWQHFERDWRRVPAAGLPADLVLFRRAEGG
jgi:hypothetical protein